MKSWLMILVVAFIVGLTFFMLSKREVKRVKERLNIADEIQARFLAETNRDFIIFWAVILLTCIVGIIEFLPNVGEFKSKWAVLAFFIGLLGGVIFSIHRCFSIYRFQAKLGRYGMLGVEIKTFVYNFGTIFDPFILKPIPSAFCEAFLISIVTAILLTLFFDKFAVNLA